MGVVGLVSMLVIVHRRKKEWVFSRMAWRAAGDPRLVVCLRRRHARRAGLVCLFILCSEWTQLPAGAYPQLLTLSTLLWEEASAAGWWRGAEALALIIGSSTSAWMRGQLKLRSADKATLLMSLLGGVLAGGGAVIGGRVFFGNVVSGWALLSFQSFVFVFFMILANWATTILYIRGLRV